MISEIGALIFFILALIFGSVGLYSLFKEDDSLEMMQGGALCGTTSVFSVFMGLLLLSPSSHFFIRFMLIIFFFLISSPTATYIVSRLIWQSNMEEQDD